MKSRSIFLVVDKSQLERTLPASSVQRCVKSCDSGRSTLNMRASTADCTTEKSKSTTFLLPRDRNSVAGCTTIVPVGTEIDVNPSGNQNARPEIIFIHPSCTDEARLSVNDYNDLKKWLDAAERLISRIASSRYQWKDECS